MLRGRRTGGRPAMGDPGGGAGRGIDDVDPNDTNNDIDAMDDDHDAEEARRLQEQRRVWGEDAGKPRPEHRRPYRLLDVYSVEQGSLRMRLFVSLMVMFVVVGAFLVVKEFMGFAIEDMDSNDMLDAFQKTTDIDQRVHLANFPPPSASISVGGSRASLNLQSVRRGVIDDPRFTSIAPLPVELAGTEFEYLYLQGSTRVDMGSSPSSRALLSSLEMVTVSVLSSGRSFGSRRIPPWRVVTDWDTAPSAEGGRVVNVTLLSEVTCTVYLFGGEWGISTVEPRYDTVAYEGLWGGIDASTIPSSTVVKVYMRDAGQPVGPVLTRWTSFWRVLVGLVLIVATVFMSCCYCCFSYVIRRNARDNMGLPPPFFASWRKFRGW